VPRLTHDVREGLLARRQGDRVDGLGLDRPPGLEAQLAAVPLVLDEVRVASPPRGARASVTVSSATGSALAGGALGGAIGCISASRPRRLMAFTGWPLASRNSASCTFSPWITSRSAWTSVWQVVQRVMRFCGIVRPPCERSSMWCTIRRETRDDAHDRQR
jgi:hypothetical protein